MGPIEWGWGGGSPVLGQREGHTQVCRSSPEFIVEFMLGHSLTYYTYRSAPVCLCQNETVRGPGLSPQGSPKVLTHCLRDTMLRVLQPAYWHWSRTGRHTCAHTHTHTQTLTRVHTQTPTFMCPHTYPWTQTHGHKLCHTCPVPHVSIHITPGHTDTRTKVPTNGRWEQLGETVFLQKVVRDRERDAETQRQRPT